MARIYQKGNNVIKMRLQHTEGNNSLSRVLQGVYEKIDKSKFVGTTSPRLGTNPKYGENQATAIYLEINEDELIKLLSGKSRVISVDYTEFETIYPKALQSCAKRLKK